MLLVLLAFIVVVVGIVMFFCSGGDNKNPPKYSNIAYDYRTDTYYDRTKSPPPSVIQDRDSPLDGSVSIEAKVEDKGYAPYDPISGRDVHYGEREYDDYMARAEDPNFDENNPNTWEE